MKKILNLSSLKFTPATVAECRTTLKDLRWSRGFVCPACGHEKAYQIKTRNLLECANKSCKRQTSPTAGTQFHNSRPRCLESFWAIISENSNKLGELSKPTIKKFMNVSAKTAARVVRIISTSFETVINKAGRITEAAKTLQIQESNTTTLLLFPWFEHFGIEFLISNVQPQHSANRKRA